MHSRKPQTSADPKHAPRQEHGKRALTVVQVVFAVLLLLLLAGLIWLLIADPSGRTDSETAGDAVSGETSGTASVPPLALSPIPLGQQLVLTGLEGVSGPFPEDGQNTAGQNLLAAVFRNDSTRTIRYATVQLTVGGSLCTFRLSTIPPGMSVRAYDLHRTAMPETVTAVSGRVDTVLYFESEPSLHTDQLICTVHDGSVTIRNTSGEAVGEEISLFFKTKKGDVYEGGITYRLRADGLKAGETVTVQHSHLSEKDTEVMFIEYGS